MKADGTSQKVILNNPEIYSMLKIMKHYLQDKIENNKDIQKSYLSNQETLDVVFEKCFFDSKYALILSSLYMNLKSIESNDDFIYIDDPVADAYFNFLKSFISNEAEEL